MTRINAAVHTADGERGYTLHIHTAGGGKGYTRHVHTAGDGRGGDTHYTSILLAVEMDTPCTSNTDSVGGGERDTHCTSKLQVVEKKYTLHFHRRLLMVLFLL
jgi:hypothetical protein